MKIKHSEREVIQKHLLELDYDNYCQIRNKYVWILSTMGIWRKWDDYRTFHHMLVEKWKEKGVI